MMKFKFDLNAMQKQALQYKGKNIILNAPTGSGKTEAFLLNIQEHDVANINVANNHKLHIYV